MARSITDTVRDFVSKRPALLECLQQELINFSSLARLICKECEIDNFPGTVVACRRVARSSRAVSSFDSEIEAVLRHAHVSVVNRLCVTVLQKPIEQDALARLQVKIRSLRGEFNSIDGRSLVTAICSARFKDELINEFRSQVKEQHEGIAQLTIVFDDKFATTPGVVAYIYSRLAMANVNIREELSCSSELLLTVDEADVPRALEALVGAEHLAVTNQG